MHDVEISLLVIIHLIWKRDFGMCVCMVGGVDLRVQ